MEYKEEFSEITENEEVAEANENEAVIETNEAVADTADNAETVDSQTQESTDAAQQAEYTPEFSELEATEEPVVVKKKKFPVQMTIIIAACVVVVALLGLFALKIFVPTIDGTWKYETEDGFAFYYTFDQSPKGDECEMTIGTIHFPGTFEVVEGEDTDNVNIFVYAGYIYGNYTYEITGNPLLKNRVLTLSNADGTVITMNEAKEPKDKEYIIPDENFEEVEALTGEWEFYYPEYDQSIYLTLNDDGTMIYDQFGMQELHCVYTATDSTINLSFFETELIAQEEEYYFDGDQLIFLGLNWTRVTDSTPDQA